MQKKFVVGNSGTDEALGRALEFINEHLEDLKLNNKDLIHAELMCEESLLRLLKHADFTKINAFTITVRKFFGDVLIDLTVPGQEFDFAASLELSPESEKVLRSNYSGLYKTLTALVLAVICGISAKTFFLKAYTCPSTIIFLPQSGGYS